MFFSFFKMLPVLVATIVLSTQVEAQDFDCSLVNKLDPNFQGTYNPDTAVALSRCYLAMDPARVKVEPLALSKLLPGINMKWEMELLDSMVVNLLTLDTSGLTRRDIHIAIANAARKKREWKKAIENYEIALPYETVEADIVKSYLMLSYLNSMVGEVSLARNLYREGMSKLTAPEKMDDLDFYEVFNSSGSVLTNLGLEIEAQNTFSKLINSPRTTARQKAMSAYNSLYVVAERRQCDTVKKYAKLILAELKEPFAIDDVNWQLMKCADFEDSTQLAKSYFKEIDLSLNNLEEDTKEMIELDYLAVLGDRVSLREKVTGIWNDANSYDDQYAISALLNGYFRNSDPELHKMIRRYFFVRDSTQVAKSQTLISELDVSANLRLKEAEALQLEAQVQKEKETRKLQYLLAAALMALLGVSLFALISSRRKSKELGIQNDSINTLNRELNHRASNQLGLAYELINDQQRYVTDDAAKALLKRSESQLMALKTVNVFLAKKSDDKLDFDVILKKVCEGLQSASPVPFALKLDLSPASVNANDVVKVALVVNELMNNSIKYAWPQEKGREPVISIQLERFGNMNRLTYSDNGGGDGGVVLGTGQGASLIQALLADVDASILNPTRSEQGGYVFGFEWDSV